MSTTNASLGAAVDDRKARLAKLKNLKRKQPGDEVAAPESTHAPSPPAASTTAEELDVTRLHLSGRNYDAETRGPKLGFESAPTLNMDGPTLEEQAAEVEAEARRKALEEAAEADKGIDLFKLQPKKPNWDLKRDLDKKLDVLRVQTDNAIAKLVRERIANSKKAEKEKQKTVPGSTGDGEAVGLDGVALVEAMRVREREDEEEERLEREEGDLA
ncbi:putative Pre-mRNA-splicing factor cwf18 [Seiridium cardinale]|uniref:Pre-mRNA-splicing factor cwf18 n=1 Tax=Seiridium cardinale TaxID=138064 RepID=A0ABR2Y7S0_9PEZI